jgi:ABC-type transport system involved in cytochrome c biogenesis, permease component
MNSWIAFWSIFTKDIKTYYLKGPNVNWGIIFPISWALMQLFSRADASMIDLLPGLITMSVLFGSTSMLAVTITFERSSRTFERLMLSPIGFSVLILAKIMGAIVFGFIIAAVPIVFASFFVSLSDINWGMVLLAAFLIAITSTLLGLLVSIPAKVVHDAMAYTNMLRFPMMFLCGMFIPLSTLPVFVRPLSYAIPLTYGTDMLNGAITGTNTMSPLLCVPVMLAFAVLIFVFCISRINRKWIY